jgi:BirA family biotin operon repressor/biotin-[acetyl-CoA-carboxylase] ligase
MKSIYNLVHFFEIESTNLKMQQDNLDGINILNKVYYTDFQTKGKGIYTNSWESQPKKNLLFSLAIYPENLNPSHQFMLTKAISLALIDTVSLYLENDKLSIKWPNDIYYEKSKLAGILTTNTINADIIELSIIGIGLNINQLNFSKEITNPISFAQITHQEYDILEVLEKVLLSINDRLTQLRELDLHHFISFEYLSRLFQLECWEDYNIKGNLHKARILGVNNYGQLILEIKDGYTQHYDLKEVAFIIK